VRIAVLGAGPAGTYFAYSWKRRHPEDDVIVLEQNARGATFGFGVVFSDRALEFLRADDPETAGLIAPCMETWERIVLVHRGVRVPIDGVGFSAIGRVELLRLLQERLASTGVEPLFETRVRSVEELSDFDLIVGADGLNSIVRRAHEGDFQTSVAHDDNKFAWFGTPRAFEALTQTFVRHDGLSFNAHHYRYAPDMSTFIVECDRDSWLGAGFDGMPMEETRRRCEQIFVDALEGAPLVSNGTQWRNFPWIWNGRWSHRNMVLLGDALHTAHYSIGSGTRLALEDGIALVRALEEHAGDVRAGLVAFEAARKPIVEKLVRASRTSADWYGAFAQHMVLSLIHI
jgi:2-polyprenyl-6-methoxyphenol hydroxylase-like FAD-dependent oxidoreductase